MSAYVLADGTIGVPPPLVAGDTTQRCALGKYITATDSGATALGDADLIYVKFTGTVAAGDLVVVSRAAKTATQSPAAATKGYFGVAMAAQTSGCYGYVMVRGVHDFANVLSGTSTTPPAYGSALTAGRITAAVTSAYIMDGLTVTTTGNVSNVGAVELYWPVCSGR